MTNSHSSLVAKFDQINAHHRDALESVRRFSDALFQMTEDDRQQVLDNLLPLQRQFLLTAASEITDARLQRALLRKDTE